jgi:hypothetical protein
MSKSEPPAQTMVDKKDDNTTCIWCGIEYVAEDYDYDSDDDDDENQEVCCQIRKVPYDPKKDPMCECECCVKN